MVESRDNLSNPDEELQEQAEGEQPSQQQSDVNAEEEEEEEEDEFLNNHDLIGVNGIIRA